MNHSKKNSASKPKQFGRLVFDSTNIGENYPGTTLPLTYSFVSKAYQEVYSHFLRVLGTSQATITHNQFALCHLLGYVQGRLYYNLPNWYRLLKLLPFYKINKIFFNRMLKPVKSVDEVDIEPSQVSRRSSTLFIFYILFPYHKARQFIREFDRLYSAYQPQQWFAESTVVLLYRFEQLRDRFFFLWANTIINDFHVMVFWGLLVSLAHRTYQLPERYLNSVVNQDMFPDSIAPLNALNLLSVRIAQQPQWRRLFSDQPDVIWNEITHNSQFVTLKIALNDYLQHYGNRSGQELKLEVPKFNEQPVQLIKLLKGYLRSHTSVRTQKKSTHITSQIKQPLWLPLTWIIRQIALRGVYRREKFRLKRGEAYAIARQVFLELGRRLQTKGHLRQAEDVFYLYYSELESLCLYQGLPHSPLKRIKQRQQHLSTLVHLKPATRIVADQLNLPKVKHTSISTIRPNKLKGTGTSITPPITAKVVVMEEFSVDTPVNGSILVTKKTDPGWTILFPMLKGIITETGSTLSHASIIARELGIPCITGVNHCTTILKTGDTVTLEPESGRVILQT